MNPIPKSACEQPDEKYHEFDTTMVDQLIWSKNRPAQLDLLLRSQQKYARGIAHTAVIYNDSHAAVFADGYSRCKAMHPWVTFRRESDFRDDVLTMLRGFQTDGIVGIPYQQGWILGNSDDNVWIDDIDLSSIHIEPFCVALSLRLNPHVSFCQPANIEIRAPELFVDDDKYPMLRYFSVGDVLRGQSAHSVALVSDDSITDPIRGPFTGMIFRWDAADPRGCWGYPHPCDSNVYRRQWLIDMLSKAEFHNPGSMENWMNSHRDRSRPFMRCFDHSKIINICNNRVQSTSQCPHATGWEPEVLARRFNEGERISLEKLQSHPSCSVRTTQCHIALPFEWERQ